MTPVFSWRRKGWSQNRAHRTTQQWEVKFCNTFQTHCLSGAIAEYWMSDGQWLFRRKREGCYAALELLSKNAQLFHRKQTETRGSQAVDCHETQFKLLTANEATSAVDENLLSARLQWELGYYLTDCIP